MTFGPEWNPVLAVLAVLAALALLATVSWTLGVFALGAVLLALALYGFASS